MTPAAILVLIQIVVGLVGAANGLVTLIEVIKKDPSIEGLGQQLIAAVKQNATNDAMARLKAVNLQLHDQAQQILAGAPVPAAGES